MVYYNQNQNQLAQQLFQRQGNQPNGGYFGMSQQRQQPNISLEQFFSITSTLDKSSLQNLVSQARASGRADKDIQAGLNIILSHR